MESESLLRLRMVPLCRLSRRRNTADGTALRRKCGDARGLGQSGSSLRLRLHGGDGLVAYRRWDERLVRHEDWQRCSALTCDRRRCPGAGANRIRPLLLRLWLLLRWLGVTPLRRRTGVVLRLRGVAGCGLRWVLRLRLLLCLRHELLLRNARKPWLEGA